MKYRYLGVNKIKQIDEANKIAEVYEPGELMKLLNGAQNIQKTDSFHIYQLGWNSICEFKTVQRQFGITALHNKTGSEFPNVFTECIVTRGVASCTFVFITDGTEHIMAHLDSGVIEKMQHLIIKFCEEHKSKPLTMICSAINDAAEQALITKLGSLCAEVIALDRGKVELGSLPKCHLEIGVSSDGELFNFFGDVCIYGQSDCKFKLFSNIEEFITLGAKINKK